LHDALPISGSCALAPVLGAKPAVPSASKSSGSGGTAMVPSGYYRFPFLSEGKTRLERVEPFRMDIRPVTVREYHGFLRKHPGWKRSRVKRLFADSVYLASWTSDDSPPAGSDELPVTQVSWYAAKAYCSSVGARLPSTAEWERVALEVPNGMD